MTKPSLLLRKASTKDRLFMPSVDCKCAGAQGQDWAAIRAGKSYHEQAVLLDPVSEFPAGAEIACIDCSSETAHVWL